MPLLSLDVDDDLAYGVKHANSLLAGFVAVCSLGELVVPEPRSIIKKRVNVGEVILGTRPPFLPLSLTPSPPRFQISG